MAEKDRMPHGTTNTADNDSPDLETEDRPIDEPNPTPKPKE